MDATILVQLDALSLGRNLCSGWKNVTTAVPIQLGGIRDLRFKLIGEQLASGQVVGVDEWLDTEVHCIEAPPDAGGIVRPGSSHPI
jgi:hypothetical protein